VFKFGMHLVKLKELSRSLPVSLLESELLSNLENGIHFKGSRFITSEKLQLLK